MPRKLRYLPDSSLVEVTCRTLHGRYLLRPSARLNELVVGVLGRAQRRTGMRVCAFVYLSNHCHLLLRPTDVEQLSRFMAYVNSNVAREAGRYHGWHGERFWGRRYTDVVISHEPEAEEARLRYLLAQGVKEGLVSSPRHWPGASSTRALGAGGALEGLWVDRSARCRARLRARAAGAVRHERREVLRLSPLPSWDSLTETQRQTRVRRLIREIEEESDRDERPVLGRDAVLRQDPFARSPLPRRRRAPRFHAVEPAVRRLLEDAYRAFRASFLRASERQGAGQPASFPGGCFCPGHYVASLSSG